MSVSLDMTKRQTPGLCPCVRTSTWLVLCVSALASRLVAALVLPNAEQDGYSYAEIIAQWTAALSAGHFGVGDLFGFWLPLFPLTAAISNIWVGNSLLTGKIFSALCGATTCLLVFAIARKLTGSVVFALLGFALLLLSPLHILYSAACMTDVPAACLILASLWFVMQRRWCVAATFGALAEGIRVEAWMLVVVLPVLQLMYERRISMISLAILLFPLVAWLGVCQLATGDAFAFFAKRARYQASYMDFYPTRHGFTFGDVRRDLEYYLLGANRGVVLAGVAAGILSVRCAIRQSMRLRLGLGATFGYAVAFVGFVLLAYLTKRQPVLLPRYGLIFFVLGLPLFMWLLRYSFEPSRRSWVPRFISAAAMVICLWEAKRQVPIISKVLADYHVHRRIAETITTAFQQTAGPDERCFSDDTAVRVLSQLPVDRFVRSESAPGFAWKGVTNFESYLRQNHVSYLVFMNIENSLPAKFYFDLGRRGEAESGIFQFITIAFSPFGPDVWLYRVRNAELSP